MRLRNINFRSVSNASGARNFFGEGFPFHRAWRHFGLSFDNTTLVAKTTTMDARLKPEKGEGNMRLQPDGTTPKHLLPDCIKVNVWHPWVLNAVGLSGPGAPALFAKGLWQQIPEELFLSFMSIQGTLSDRLTECTEFVKLAAKEMRGRYHPWALEMNFSCPNVGLEASKLIDEVGQACQIADRLGVPLQAKFSATTPSHAIVAACQHSACDSVVIGNTVAWKDIPPVIKNRLFRRHDSPLKKYGGGGLSSPEFVPIVCAAIKEARESGFHKPILAGNGFYSCSAVKMAIEAGASGIQFGCGGIVRPRQMKRIIPYANQLFPSS